MNKFLELLAERESILKRLFVERDSTEIEILSNRYYALSIEIEREKE